MNSKSYPPQQSYPFPWVVLLFLLALFALAVTYSRWPPPAEPCRHGNCPADLAKQLATIKADLATLSQAQQGLAASYSLDVERIGYDRADIKWCKAELDKQRGRLDCFDVRLTGLEEDAAEAKEWEDYYRAYRKYLADWVNWFNTEYGSQPKGR